MAVSDIPGDYLDANMDKKLMVMFHDRLYKLMTLTTHEVYRKCAMMGNRNMVLYMRLRKDLYGCMRSAIFVYK